MPTIFDVLVLKLVVCFLKEPTLSVLEWKQVLFGFVFQGSVIQYAMYLCYMIFTAIGVGLSPLYCGHFWPIVPAPDDRWRWLWSNWWNEDWQGKPKYSEKTCPTATLSTTNPTWPDPGSNPGRRGWKPTTNRLSYGAALCFMLLHRNIGRVHWILFTNTSTTNKSTRYLRA
jgi:hypothetical protein